jgi:hypothetical protein
MLRGMPWSAFRFRASGGSGQTMRSCFLDPERDMGASCPRRRRRCRPGASARLARVAAYNEINTLTQSIFDIHAAIDWLAAHGVLACDGGLDCSGVIGRATTSG